jgi:hypothetical protein
MHAEQIVMTILQRDAANQDIIIYLRKLLGDAFRHLHIHALCMPGPYLQQRCHRLLAVVVHQFQFSLVANLNTSGIPALLDMPIAVSIAV